MSEPEVDFDPYLPSFNLSPAAFPWSAAKVADVAEARKVMSGLFFDELLGMASVDAGLYPPMDTLTLRHLLNAIQASVFDRLKKDCLVYYLLLDYAGQEQAATFKAERALPARFARLTEGYWFLDGRRYEDAVKSLTQPSLTPDFVPKIVRTLSQHPSPLTAARLVNRFLSLATPELTTDGEIDIKVDALARVNFREAWEFVEGLGEGERKQELIKRVIVATLAPKPVPAHLQLLLAFPFSAGSEKTLHALCLQPPSLLNKASIKVLHDLAHTRLIAQGRLLDAIRLDRSIGSGREGAQRRETIERLVRIVPEVQRRILEVEMGGADKDRAKAATSSRASDEYPPAPTPAATLIAPMPIPAAFQHQQNLPLSASQVLRTSSPQLSVHRAILSPAAAAPPSPARDGSTQQAKRPFAFPAPLPGPSSPARSSFAQADVQTSSPFGGRAAFALPSSSANPSLPAHYLPQRQTISASPAAPSARAPSVTTTASPFAQAAKQASQAAYRTSLLNRDNRARQESPRFQSPAIHRSSSFVRNDLAEDDDDEMLVVESPPPAAVKKRTTGRQSKEKAADKPTTKVGRSSRRSAPEEPKEEDVTPEQAEDEHEEADTLPGAFPGAADTAAKTPSTRRKASARVANEPNASKPDRVQPATGRVRRAPSVPGSFTTGATSDEDSDGQQDELTLDDLAPLPPAGSSRRKSTRSAQPAASSSGYGLRGHVRTRSMSVASDDDEDDHASEGKTPPPAHRRRTLRSSVTVSPEAVRRAPKGRAGSSATKTRNSGSKLKESSTAAPTRRSTRRTGGGDE